MTKVKILRRNKYISHIEVKGHALSNKFGKDIVCAGISTVVQGICNALEELSVYDEDRIILQEDAIIIPEIPEDEKVQLICEVMVSQLKMIEKSYPKYIEISFQQEV